MRGPLPERQQIGWQSWLAKLSLSTQGGARATLHPCLSCTHRSHLPVVSLQGSRGRHGPPAEQPRRGGGLKLDGPLAARIVHTGPLETILSRPSCLTSVRLTSGRQHRCRRAAGRAGTGRRGGRAPRGRRPTHRSGRRRLRLCLRQHGSIARTLGADALRERFRAWHGAAAATTAADRF